MSSYRFVSLNGQAVYDLLQKYNESHGMMDDNNVHRLTSEIKALLDKARDQYEQNRSTGFDKNAMLVQ